MSAVVKKCNVEITMISDIHKIHVVDGRYGKLHHNWTKRKQTFRSYLVAFKRCASGNSANIQNVANFFPEIYVKRDNLNADFLNYLI